MIFFFYYNPARVWPFDPSLRPIGIPWPLTCYSDSWAAASLEPVSRLIHSHSAYTESDRLVFAIKILSSCGCMDINVLVTLLSSIYCWLVTLFLLSTHSSFFFFSLIFNFLCVLSGVFFFSYKVWTAVLCYLKESRCAAGLFLKLRFPIPEIPFAKCLFPGCCFPVCLFQPGDVCDTDWSFILLDRPTGKWCLYRRHPSCFASYFALCFFSPLHVL